MGDSSFSRRSASAFTLIELLVVVAIIAILMAILMPSLASARSKAVSLSCMSNVKQVNMLCLLYAQQNDNCWINYSSTSNRWPKALMNEGLLITKRVTLVVCPADKSTPTNSTVLKWELGGSYGFNNDLNGYGNGPSISGLPYGKRIMQVTNPGQYITFWDSNQPLVASSTLGWVFDRSTYTTRTPDPSRHRGFGNASYMDGHAESLRVDPTLEIKASQVKFDNTP